jgi:hypothetical protein
MAYLQADLELRAGTVVGAKPDVAEATTGRATGATTAMPTRATTKMTPGHAAAPGSRICRWSRRRHPTAVADDVRTQEVGRTTR